MAARFLLGPQRPSVNVDLAFDSLADEGPVAVVSAGWQEGEGDVEELRQAVPRPLTDLELYRRAEAVLNDSAVLREIYRARQDRLQELQRLYRLRLKQSMIAARRLLRADGDPLTLKHERRHAISQQRALDRHHLQRINAIHREFERHAADRQPSIWADHAGEIAGLLDGCRTVAVTGGNVAVLMNRLRMFEFAPLLRHKHIIAWSAGAMVLTDRIVLFHDHTPEGRRDAEVFDQGLGLVNDLVVLPDARHRLNVRDKTNVALFCRRFAPAGCITLDSGALLKVDAGGIGEARDVQRLTRSGALRKVRGQ